MPFPATLEDFYRAGYIFLRGGKCSECGGEVHVFKTPGGREIAMEPNFDTMAPAIRHYERCNIAPKEERSGNSQDVAGRDSDGGTAASICGRGGRVRLLDNSETGIRDCGPHSQGSGIKLYRVADKNMIAVGWLGGTLAVQFRYGRYHYSNVPEDVFTKIRDNPFPNNMFVKLVKNHPELYPYTKVSQ